MARNRGWFDRSAKIHQQRPAQAAVLHAENVALAIKLTIQFNGDPEQNRRAVTGDAVRLRPDRPDF